jgi:hypothetical protein
MEKIGDFCLSVDTRPTQIEWITSRLGNASQVKLYNSGNLFDRKAIPVEDYKAIAKLLDGYETVVVESHPKLIRDSLTF